jgi:hypothetical protein
MSLRDRAYYIADHAYELAGPDHLVDDCTKNSDWENVLLVAAGKKPLCEVESDLSAGKIRSLPQVSGLAFATPRIFLLGEWHTPTLFGKPEHIEAYDQACFLRNHALHPQADVLFGLAFGYPEDKIARFVVNGIERYGHAV